MKRDLYLVTPMGWFFKYDYSEDKVTGPKGGFPSETSSGYSAKSTTVYTVKSGDTLWSISQKYHTSVTAITSENNIKDKQVIVIGQELKITN